MSDKDKSEIMSKKGKETGGKIPKDSDAAGFQSTVDSRKNPEDTKREEMRKYAVEHDGEVDKGSRPSGHQSATDK